MTRERSNGLKMIFEVIGITLLALLISVIVGVMFLIPMLIMGFDIQTTSVIVGIAIIGQLGFLFVAIFYIRKRNIPVPIEMPSLSDTIHIAGGILLTLITAAALSQLLYFLDLMPESPLEEMAAADPRLLLALAFLSVILVAPAEELLFRGAIQGRLRQRFGPIPSIVTASILFGALHLGNYTGALLPIIMGAVLITVVSLILGALYDRTDNLVVPITVHAIYNVVLLLISYAAIT